MTVLLGLDFPVLLLVSQIVYIMVVSEQVGSTKVQFIILRKAKLMCESASQVSGGADSIPLLYPELLQE